MNDHAMQEHLQGEVSPNELPPAESPPFLAGGGDLGARMRSFNRPLVQSAAHTARSATGLAAQPQTAAACFACAVDEVSRAGDERGQIRRAVER